LPVRDRLGGVAAVAGVVDIGSLPSAAPGVSIALSLTWKYLRATALGTIFAAQTEETSRGGGGEFQLFTAGIDVCVEQPIPPIRPLGCVGLELGEMTGRGVEVPNSHAGSAFWVAPTLDAGVSFSLSGAFALAARVGAVVPLRRPEFVLGGTEAVFRASSLAARGALGLEFAW
jgi:hypothetical protein